MIDVKMSVDIILPGGVMYTEQECSENPNLYNINSLSFFYKNKHEKITYATRKTKPAVMRINISSNQYKMMVDNYNPVGISQKEWRKLKENDKINYHLKQLCEDMNGISYSYVVFKD